MLDHKKFVKFSDAEIGTTIERPVLVTLISENIAKNKKPYLKITLKDGFSEIIATKFDTTAAAIENLGLYKGCVATAVLQVTEYMGSKSFNIDSIMLCLDKDITPDDFVKLPPVNIDVMYDEICTILRNAADDFNGQYLALSEHVISILEKYKKQYISSSAAVSMHHNLKGGLLYHSYRMVKAADALCNVYTNLDRELLLCGAALHDIGKIWEYETSDVGDADFTTRGVLFGHLYMGASIVKSGGAAECNREKIQMLQHLILSHHGTLEWGAVVNPATSEAYVLHYIDNIDAKLYVCEEYNETLTAGKCSEKKPFGFDNRIYKPNY